MASEADGDPPVYQGTFRDDEGLVRVLAVHSLMECIFIAVIIMKGTRRGSCWEELPTSVRIAKKSSKPNLWAGITDIDQHRSNTARVARSNMTVQSAISSGCLLASFSMMNATNQGPAELTERTIRLLVQRRRGTKAICSISRLLSHMFSTNE